MVVPAFSWIAANKKQLPPKNLTCKMSNIL
jgi:hypothetical protein